MRVEAPGGQQVRSQVVRGPQASPVNTGMEQAASSLTNSVIKGIQIKDQIDTTEAKDRLNSAKKDWLHAQYNAQDGYFNTEGQTAFTSADGAIKTLQDIRDQYAKGLSGNALRKYQEVADAYLTRYSLNIQRHAAAGRERWEDATSRATIDGYLEDATFLGTQTAVPVPGVPGKTTNRLEETLAAGENEIMDYYQRKGLEGDALNHELEEFRSSFYTQAIQGMLERYPKKARELFKDKGSMIRGKDYTEIQSAFERQDKRAEAESRAGRTTRAAYSLLDGSTSQAQILERAKQLPEDIRSSAVNQAVNLYRMQKQAKQEQVLNAYNAFEDFSADGGTPEQFIAQHPQEWEALDTKHQQAIMAGEATQTQWDEYSRYRAMSPQELAKVDVSKLTFTLAPDQRREVASWVSDARKGLTKTLGNAGFRTAQSQINARAYALYPRSPSGQKDKYVAERATFFQLAAAALDQNAVDGVVDMRRLPEVLDNLTASSVTGEHWYGDSTADLSDLSAKEQRDAAAFLQKYGVNITAPNMIAYEKDTMPEEDRKAVTAYAVDHGLPTDKETLYRIWFSGRRGQQ